MLNKLKLKLNKHALSFYRSQNVLGRSNFFCARPKIELHLVPLQKYLYRHKNWIYANHLLVWHKKFGTSTICKSIFGLIQKVWTIANYFGTKHMYLSMYLRRLKSRTCVSRVERVELALRPTNRYSNLSEDLTLKYIFMLNTTKATKGMIPKTVRSFHQEQKTMYVLFSLSAVVS